MGNSLVGMQPHAKKLHEIFTKGRSWPSNKVSRRFYFGGDPDWPSLSFRGHSRPASHFGIKSTVAQKRYEIWPKLLQNTNRKSYVFCLMAPFLTTFEHFSRSNHNRRRCVFCEKSIPVTFWPWHISGHPSGWNIFFRTLIHVIILCIMSEWVRCDHKYDTSTTRGFNKATTKNWHVDFFDSSWSVVACCSQSQSSRLMTSVGASNFVEIGAGKIVWFRDWKLDRTLSQRERLMGCK